ncbi:hypothetical protein [Candidatus Magnetobacterium casense]|uniref:Transposase n=1 Tax=Candidatus Magnetobacterium casense TaxID=1455061 RepID=A0ABS6RUN2_9BACT|nr:hypothetical protein [Candidatus Magnetobacterium casensis]MBV6340340.1 hypothetical protein [Candidatus Magnetobacterium casensis]
MKATIDGMTIEGTAEEMLTLIKVRGRTPRPLPNPSEPLQVVDETPKVKYRRHKHWKPTEIQALKAGLDRQDSFTTIARGLYRTTLGVRSKAFKLGLINAQGQRIGQEV